MLKFLFYCFQARNRLNEQQNSKLAAHREILLQRKDEMAQLDQRIADLQCRIRKKRVVNQQQENLYNLRTGTGAKIGNRPLSANIAAVEPYIKHDPKEQHISQDINKNNTDKPYGISKQDPKYQTLPYNIKFPGGNGSGDAKKDLDKAGNNKVETDKLKADQGKSGSALNYLPKEVIHNAPDFKPSVGHATAFEAMQDTLKDSNLPLTTPSKNAYGAYKPTSSLTNFTPRPFGSTYSTSSILTNRTSIGTTTPQNSPGNNTTLSSSFGYQGIPGYPKTSTPLASNENSARTDLDDTREILITNAARVSMPSRTEPTNSMSNSTNYPTSQYQQPLSVVTSGVYQAESSSHSPRTGPPVYQVATSRLQPPAQPQHTVAPPSPASSSGSTSSSQKGPTDRPAGGPPPYGYHKSQQALPHSTLSAPSNVPYSRPHSSTDQYTNKPTVSVESKTPFSSSVSQYDSRPPTKDVFASSQRSSTLPLGPVDSKHNAKEADVSSALSVLKSGPSTTVVNTKPSYRYAPKSVIANTYMKRLGPGALDQYRKMTELYSHFLPGQTGVLGDPANTPSSPTARVQPMNVDPKSQEKPEKSPSKESEHEHSGSQDSSDGSDTGKGGPPAYKVAPPYDMDVERMRYQTNAPKLRRRLSSGESDFSHSRNLSQNDTNSSVHNISNKTTPTTTYEKENDISQADTTPEIVRLDDLQDSYNNNKLDNDPFDKAIIPLSEADRDSPEEPREGEPTVKENLPVALRRKKGNLRNSHSSSKHSRRVSFDPLALLLDASLEGELALVKRTAKEVKNPSFLLLYHFSLLILTGLLLHYPSFHLKFLVNICRYPIQVQLMMKESQPYTTLFVLDILKSLNFWWNLAAMSMHQIVMDGMSEMGPLCYILRGEVVRKSLNRN